MGVLGKLKKSSQAFKRAFEKSIRSSEFNLEGRFERVKDALDEFDT